MASVKKTIVRISLAVMLALTLVVVLPAPPVDAATCTCFCTDKDGALPGGKYPEVGECKSACEAANRSMVTCAATYAQYPSSNLRCFTREACAKVEGVFSVDQTPKFQPPECLNGQGYCYPAQKDYSLAVPLGEVKSVQGLSGYISSAYSYLLNISITIAIVFIMIGGLQYVLAAGSGQVGKAKERIMNALAGLVLLLFAYVILYTVNPNLITLQLPQLPMIKKVVLIDDESCEDLVAKKFTIGTGTEIQDKYTGTENSKPVCGSSTIVKTDESGSPVAEGTTCDFKDCKAEGKEKGCYIGPEKAECVSCIEVFGAGAASAGSDLAPSVSVCAALERPCSNDTNPCKDGAGNTTEKNYCFYTHDPGVIVSGWDIAALASVPLTGGLTAGIAVGVTADTVEQSRNGACAEVALDCTSITKCADYGGKTVKSGFTSNQVDDLAIGGFLGSPVNWQTICNEDPCGAGKKEGKTKCVYGNLNYSLAGYSVYTTAACVAQ